MKEVFKNYIIFTLIPFLIPFLLEIPENWINKVIQWGLVVSLIIIDSIWCIYFTIKRNKETKKRRNLEEARKALSSAITINIEKRNYLLQNSYKYQYDYKTNVLLYNVHGYIENICKELKSLTSLITGIQMEFLSVSFIYRYTYENGEWKWITGKNSTAKETLQQIISDPETLYYNLIHSAESYIFENDKMVLRSKNKYKLGFKDKNYNGIGSIMSIKMMFMNNNQCLTEGILTISSYGRQFVSSTNDKITVQDFTNLFMWEIIPYFRSLIETELGFLYMRHVNLNKDKLSVKKKGGDINKLIYNKKE